MTQNEGCCTSIACVCLRACGFGSGCNIPGPNAVQGKPDVEDISVLAWLSEPNDCHPLTVSSG